MEFESQPPEVLDAVALATMRLRHHDELIAYRVDGGLDVMRLIETGETQLQTWQVGRETMSFEVAVKEPIIDASFDSFEAYTGPQQGKSDHQDNVPPEAKPEQNPQFSAELAAITTKAAEKAEQLMDADKFEPCSRGCENGIAVGVCQCMNRSSSYTDVDRKTVEIQEVGVADPECGECGGTGQHASRCGECKGAGEVLTNPLVAVMNHETGQEAGFRLEVARLIANGDIEMQVEEPQPGYIRSSQPTPPQRTVTMDFSGLMHKLAATVGIDTEHGQYYTYWGKKPMETRSTTFGCLLRPLSVNVATADQFESLEAFAEATLEALQSRALRSLRKDMYRIDLRKAEPSEIRDYAQTLDLEMNDNLTIRKFGLRLDKAGSPHANLQELINILSIYNYRLGLTYTGLGTDELGPALYILDRAGNALYEINSGYDASLVLENSCRIIRELHLDGRINPGN